VPLKSKSGKKMASLAHYLLYPLLLMNLTAFLFKKPSPLMLLNSILKTCFAGKFTQFNEKAAH